MNERENNKRGIFYGVIGVATLVVAIIGATFAYFTASQDAVNSITGNMASITFELDVHKVTTADDKKGGMIPLSSAMVEAALTGTDTATNDPKICVDDNGNAVCQVYKITVLNSGTAGMFLDGYVTLTGGSGTPVDAENWVTVPEAGKYNTTMRWAQAFCVGTDNQLTSCTTKGVTTTTTTALNAGGTEETRSGFGSSQWSAIDLNNTTIADASYEADKAAGITGYNRYQMVYTGTSGAGYNEVVSNGKIQGNSYPVIDQNYIRISDRSATATSYDRKSDVTSALVYNQFISPNVGTTKATAIAEDYDESLTDAQVFYIVVWLAETGYNQTAGAVGSDGTTALPGVPSEENANHFFSGNVTFISAQGSEVTATFGGFTAVESDQE